MVGNDDAGGAGVIYTRWDGKYSRGRWLKLAHVSTPWTPSRLDPQNRSFFRQKLWSFASACLLAHHLKSPHRWFFLIFPLFIFICFLRYVLVCIMNDINVASACLNYRLGGLRMRSKTTVSRRPCSHLISKLFAFERAVVNMLFRRP